MLNLKFLRKIYILYCFKSFFWNVCSIFKINKQKPNVYNSLVLKCACKQKQFYFLSMWSRAEMCITVQYTVALVDVLVQYKRKCERLLCNEICAHIISFIVSAFADSMIISKNCKHARECSNCDFSVIEFATKN